MKNKESIKRAITGLRIFSTMALAIGALLVSIATYVIHNKFQHINNENINVGALEEREERPYIILSIILFSISFLVEIIILYLRWRINKVRLL